MGKNNKQEWLKKQSPKKIKYALRKLSVGLASIGILSTFMINSGLAVVYANENKSSQTEVVDNGSEKDHLDELEQSKDNEETVASEPKEEAPKEETPKEEVPKEEAPKEEVPKEEVPKEEAPKEEAPKEEAPKEETPKEEANREIFIELSPNQDHEEIGYTGFRKAIGFAQRDLPEGFEVVPLPDPGPNVKKDALPNTLTYVNILNVQTNNILIISRENGQNANFRVQVVDQGGNIVTPAITYPFEASTTVRMIPNFGVIR